MPNIMENNIINYKVRRYVFDVLHMNMIPYASAIGSILYVMICTRPDVSYALSVTSRYQADPGESHLTAVKNILKYLRMTKDVFLIYEVRMSSL